MVAETFVRVGSCHDRNTNRGIASVVAGGLKEDARVFVVSNRSSLLVALATAVWLCGCANNDYDMATSWFSKPIDLFGSKGGYSYSNLGDAKRDRPVAANDLVDANGACPRIAAPTPMQPVSNNAATNPALAADASLLGGGVAIGMSECDVVARLGQATAVNLGRNPNGDRSAVLTFKSGPRPGIYRFASGRLMEMDRVELPPPPRPEPAKKKIVKKKPEQPQEPPTTPGKT
jgi:hypothetical protein